MIGEPRFTDDVADLPTHKFGPSSLTWWGIIGFMVIEGAFFALAFAAYFFLMGHEQGWPPEGAPRRTCLPGTLFTIIILLSEIPNTMIKKAAHDARRADDPRADAGDRRRRRRAAHHPRVRVQQPQLPLDRQRLRLDRLGIAAAPHDPHPHRLGRHGGAVAADAARRLAYEGRRLVDVDENSLYWRYVWLLWIPIYLMIYWVPRL